MTWPQWFVAIYLVLDCIAAISRSAHSDESPGTITAAIVLDVAQLIGIVFVLRAGGFW